MKPYGLVAKLRMFCLLGMGFVAVGCSSTLVGTWENTGKADDAKFVITNATFNDNGTYVASAKQGEENVRLAGTYEFDGFNLKLKNPGKPERKYGATYMMMGQTLEIRDGKDKQMLKKK